MDAQPPIAEARRAARQVSLLTFAGMATALLVVLLVSWALVELRASERELRRFRELTDTSSQTLHAAMTEALSERLDYLDERRPFPEVGTWAVRNAGVVAALRPYLTSAAEVRILDGVEATFVEARESILECRDWRLRNDRARRAFETRLADLRGTLDRLGEHFASIEGSFALDSVAASDAAKRSAAERYRVDAGEIRIELVTLATLIERVCAEPSFDLLAHHQNNLIAPCLARIGYLLQGLPLAPQASNAAIDALLAKVREDLLGATALSGSATNSLEAPSACLFTERRAVMNIGEALESVRRVSGAIMDKLQQADWAVHDLLDERNQSLAIRLGTVLRQDRDALVAVGGASVLALGFLGLRVRRTLRGQMGALATAYHEARVAAEGLAQQKYALDQHAIVAVTDIRGTISYVNDRFCQLAGFTREELIGMTHRVVNSELHTQDYFADMMQTINGGQVWRGLTRNRRKDGQLYWVHQTIVPIRDVDGRISEFVSIQLDVTEHQKREAELVEAKRLAEAGSRAKSEFLAMMSHEIRTPMNAIVGFATLLEATRLDDQQREFARLINESSSALLRIINDILDLSRVEAGKLEVERIDFQLPELVEQVAEIILSQVETRGLAVGVRWLPGVSTRVLGDPGRVRQVLLNLAGNAAKFTSTGHILIEISPYWPDGIGEVLVDEGSQGQTEAPAVRIAVVDTGIGVAEEAQARLFQTFSQADNSTTRRFGGTGLGLAISRRLVELMGGRIGMSSRVGEGSVFWFTLPVGLRSQPMEATAQTWEEGRRILVVQAHPGLGGLMRRQLQDWRVNHDLVRSGAEALECLWGAVEDGSPYDTVLLDAVLPGMPAERLRDAIRHDPVLSGLKLILTGTTGAAERFRRLEDAGFDGSCLNPTVQTRAWHRLLEGVAGAGPRLGGAGSKGPQPPRSPEASGAI